MYIAVYCDTDTWDDSCNTGGCEFEYKGNGKLSKITHYS